ncbi:MerR family transcriptional regulator [Streptomyces sp. NPDC000410]|uniref:MerR family transcriptional regulator n=1 Tax=Streptomyces sp. NPDC000410 TaxID=3154254 RepID=UPI00331E4529
MQIGEIASLVGVTTRAIRHYHHLGLLPEPERRANGYRDYSLRDVVLLARVRRLTELGLGLDEVRDVLADDAGRELVEVLEELDEDLARQRAELDERRRRLSVLLDQARGGRLPAEGPVSPQLAALLANVPEVPESAMAAKDREMLALFDTVMPAEERERFMAGLRTVTEAPGAVERAHEVYAMLDALADAEPADPRVDEAARTLAGLLPDEVAAQLKGAETMPEGAFVDAFYAEFAPAQAEVVRRALRLVVERVR